MKGWGVGAPLLGAAAAGLTCGSSRALITAAKPNMLPRLLFSSAANWMVLWSRAALSSVLPVQPSRSTATMMDMVLNLGRAKRELQQAREAQGRRRTSAGWRCWTCELRTPVVVYRSSRSSLSWCPCGSVSSSSPEVTPIILCTSGLTPTIRATCPEGRQTGLALAPLCFCVRLPAACVQCSPPG